MEVNIWIIFFEVEMVSNAVPPILLQTEFTLLQVSKDLAVGDGVRIVNDPEKPQSSIVTKDGQVITDLDTPLPRDCKDAKEFIIIRDMYIAAVEERFIDAAKLRDELEQFRQAERMEIIESSEQKHAAE